MSGPSAPLGSTRRRLAATLLALAALFAACGGGATAPATSATTTPAAGLTAFRYELKQTSKGVLGPPQPGAEDPTIVIDAMGEVAGPRREHVATKMSLGGSAVSLERIEVDDRAWSRGDVNAAWSEDRPGGSGGLAGLRVDPAVMLGAEANARLRSALEGLSPTVESIGGIETLRYTVPASKMRVILGAGADSPATSVGRIEADSTLWVTKDGVLPVRIVIDTKPAAGGETHLEVAFRDHNASGIKVEPPK